MLSSVLIISMAVSLNAQGLAKSTKIGVILKSISLEKNGDMKADKTFKSGETVYINLLISGLKANDNNQVTVQADLNVPCVSIDQKNIVNGTADYDDTVPVTFWIPIGEVSRGGVCSVKITIRDMIAKTYVEYKTNFNLTAD
jgi:hypothetical protein